MELFADLHVHLGSALGRPVKISASRQLTLEGICRTAGAHKGLGVVGLVDALTTGGLQELGAAVADGRLRELPGGGFGTRDGLVLLSGIEVELVVSGRRVHFVAFVPDLGSSRRLAARLARHITNPWLSSQQARGLDPGGLLEAVWASGGLLWPAHAFTPHRGLLGAAVRRISAPVPEGLGQEVAVALAAVELGLSADTDMADRLSELGPHTFVSNSDAHSLGTLGREANLVRLEGPADFEGVAGALARRGRAGVLLNVGLDPRLGKYHRTVCLACVTQASAPPPVLTCPTCGSARVVTGVLDRLTAIADRAEPMHPPYRPPYRAQVPLAFLPGVGPVTQEHLRTQVGPELHVLHRAPREDLERAAGPRIAELILQARDGRLELAAGGGGRYGQVRG